MIKLYPKVDLVRGNPEKPLKTVRFGARHIGVCTFPRRDRWHVAPLYAAFGDTGR